MQIRQLLIFKYQTDDGEFWYGEDLKAKTYPFLLSPADYIIISSKYGVQRGLKTTKGLILLQTLEHRFMQQQQV